MGRVISSSEEMAQQTSLRELARETHPRSFFIISFLFTSSACIIHVYISAWLPREMQYTHTHTPSSSSHLQPPQSWPRDAEPIWSPRGLTRASSSGPSCSSAGAVMNAAVAGRRAWASHPRVSPGGGGG